MKKEIWKPVVGYEGHYQVSNCGRVKSIKFGKEIIMKQNIRRGYYYVNLYKNGILKTYQVHRLVAEAFLDNPDNLPCVNHKDENKLNNNVDNLEWCTIRYNNCYNDGQIKRARFKRKKVYQYDLNGNLIKEWISVNDAGRNGYNQGNVAACCRGERKTYKGFRWSYKKEGE